MIADDRAAFFVEIRVLAQMRRVEVSPTLLSAYFEDLAEYDLEDVIGAIRLARKELVYFPQPVELIERIRNLRSQRRALAASEQKALAPAPETSVEIEAARSAFFEFVRKLANSMAPGAASRQVFAPVSEKEQVAHEARKQQALERARKVFHEGFSGDPSEVQVSTPGREKLP